jgi:hypothetical protein
MLKNCAQIVPKICQEYQNVSKDIEIHRNPGALENGHLTGQIHYLLLVSFGRRFLHTIEVTGSNPVSPTDLSEDAIELPPDWPGGSGGGNKIRKKSGRRLRQP